MGKLKVRRGNTIEMRSVAWLWKGRIPRNKVTLIQGDGGEGKSSFTLYLEAGLSIGKAPPSFLEDDDTKHEPMNVFYVSTEDESEDTALPRFVRFGGDINRYYDNDEKECHFELTEECFEEVYETCHPGIMIIDPYESFINPSELASWLSAVPGKVVVIITSCGSGGFITDKSEVNASGTELIQKSIDGYTPEAFDNAILNAFEICDTMIETDLDLIGKAGDLRNVKTSQSGENKFYVITASRFKELAFSGKLVEWLEKGIGTSGNMPADTKYAGNRDGLLTLHELYSYVSGVGDKTRIKSSVDSKYYYQHVCCYPKNSSFVFLRK